MKVFQSSIDQRPEVLPEAAPLAGVAARGGVAMFWVVNDECDREVLRRDLESFARAGVDAVVLHPRGGLLLPYGGSDWFEFVEWAVAECRRLGLELIFYDEDPYPSGNAGGRITAENPEWIGYEIQPFFAPDDLEAAEPFVFPIGRLCWAGIVFPEEPERAPIDLTPRVGTLRRYWEKAEWDSKWYYPDTPLYPCPRAMSHHAEYGLRLPPIPVGGRVVAFVARPCAAPSEWGNLVDTLNPEATRRFLALTHERYAALPGQPLGREILTCFTDEAKPHSRYSWTPGIFESFERQFGYDLRPQLHALFEDQGVVGMRVRIDYRLWISERFERAWVQPVARWAQEHQIGLVGHLSPEEDLVSQSASLGNLFPLQKHFSLAGFDLIIPAIGDAQHPILSVGAVQAISAAQQTGKPGVCCEALGAFGLDGSPWHLGRVMGWLVLHGVTMTVVHGSFTSSTGLRRMEAPPDYGPRSTVWPAMEATCRQLQPFYRKLSGAVQEAPVAILWPILSFHAKGSDWVPGQDPYRTSLQDLLQWHLSEQIGVHLLDEADLLRGEVIDGQLVIGNARYRQIVIPSTLVLHQATATRLEQLATEGIALLGVGEPPRYLRQADGEFREVDQQGRFTVPWASVSPEVFRASYLPDFPRLIELPPALRPHIQASRWERDGEHFLLLFHVGQEALSLPLPHGPVCLEPGDLLCLGEQEGGWTLERQFSPAALPPALPNPPVPTFGKWRMAFPPYPPLESEQPLAFYQIAPTRGTEMIEMILTPPVALHGGRASEDLVYEVDLTLPAPYRRAVLLVEPTLMRGRFTLEVGGRHWSFQVRDTGIAIQRIDLTPALNPDGPTSLRFTLHEPESSDGIKSTPLFELA